MFSQTAIIHDQMFTIFQYLVQERWFFTTSQKTRDKNSIQTFNHRSLYASDRTWRTHLLRFHIMPRFFRCDWMILSYTSNRIIAPGRIEDVSIWFPLAARPCHMGKRRPTLDLYRRLSSTNENRLNCFWTVRSLIEILLNDETNLLLASSLLSRNLSS